jgi:hypothetical protein
MLMNRMKKDAARDADPRERSLWADLMSIGMVFPIAIVAGLFAGRWIGGWFGHRELGQWLGLAWGVAAAFWELFKTSQKLDRFDAAEAKDLRDAEAAKREAPMGGEGREDDDRP